MTKKYERQFLFVNGDCFVVKVIGFFFFAYVFFGVGYFLIPLLLAKT